MSDFYPPPATKRDASGSPATKNARIPFLLEGTTIHLNYTSSELATGSELILMRFEAPAAGIWKIRVYHTLSIQGEYHMWLPVHGFISDETFFLAPGSGHNHHRSGQYSSHHHHRRLQPPDGRDLSAFQPRFYPHQNYQARPCRPRASGSRFPIIRR